MSLSPGTKLGPYEILGTIGAGGMGEVYRARDARLARDVAVKVLPASFVADRDRLRRFEQEVRATGQLNHPNILAAYDTGTHEGAPYVVEELLEGMTLREKMAGGPVPARKASDYARQMAQGLAAAHQKGIIHRDLKPENLFVLNDGRLKILDFGLAKLTRPEGAGASRSEASGASGSGGAGSSQPEGSGSSPTGGHGTALTQLPTQADTAAGVVLGTVGYMSPEQVRGQPADHRSDIFSLGSVLYEMLTGRRAFAAASSVETMNAILNKEPPEISRSIPDIPPGLERVVQHCLEKSPDERFQAAHDLAFQLEALSGVSTPAAMGHAGSPGAARGAGLGRLLGLAAVLVVGALGWFPDGKRLLLVAGEKGRLRRLYVMEGEGGTPKAISPEGVGFGLAISPDGRLVAASIARGPVQIFPVERGEPRPVPGSAPGDRPSIWSTDGRSLFVVVPVATAARIDRLDLATGRRETVKTLMPADQAGLIGTSFVFLSSDARSYVYSYRRILSTLYLVDGLR